MQNASRFPGAKLGPDTTIAIEHEGEPELRILPEHYQDVIAGDLPAETIEVLALTQRSVRVQAQEFMAERAGSHVVRVEASHAVAISQPDEVADLIIEAARPPADPSLVAATTAYWLRRRAQDTRGALGGRQPPQADRIA